LYDDVHTASATPKVEEGAKRLIPSSFEFLFPQVDSNLSETQINHLQHRKNPCNDAKSMIAERL